MKHPLDQQTVDWCEVTMPLEVAQAALAADGSHVKECVDRFWNTPLRTGDRRYYDNFLYLFAMLALSGNYRIYRK